MYNIFIVFLQFYPSLRMYLFTIGEFKTSCQIPTYASFVGSFQFEAVSWQHGYDMTTPSFYYYVYICDDRYELLALKRPTAVTIRVIDFTITSFYVHEFKNKYVPKMKRTLLYCTFRSDDRLISHVLPPSTYSFKNMKTLKSLRTKTPEGFMSVQKVIQNCRHDCYS